MNGIGRSFCRKASRRAPCPGYSSSPSPSPLSSSSSPPPSSSTSGTGSWAAGPLLSAPGARFSGSAAARSRISAMLAISSNIYMYERCDKNIKRKTDN